MCKGKRRLGNMGNIFADNNKTMRCVYILAILHASLYIVRKIILEVGENTRLRNQGIEELICITERKLFDVVTDFVQNLVQYESVLQVSICR